MKNIFKVHPITYLILISILLCGYFNYFLIISLILIFHDLGHVILIKLFKYKIENILILPFGSMINTNINSNSKTLQILLISIAGILFQLILYPIMNLLIGSLINQISYQIFLKFNKILLIFNLLPIIPLDGSKILLSLLESIMSYKKALKLLNIISIMWIIIFIWYSTFNALNAYLIITFLGYKTFEAIKDHSYIFHHFLLERVLNKPGYKKVKYIPNIKKIYKNKYNFINHQNEEKVLSNYLMP